MLAYDQLVAGSEKVTASLIHKMNLDKYTIDELSGFYKSVFESRFLLEAASLPLFSPMLKSAPYGDGHPVLAIPGFSAGDAATLVMRQYLESKGYEVYAWAMGANVGVLAGLEKRLVERVIDLSEQYGSKVSLIGWSLGGLFARYIASQIPDHVRTVISLGSPIHLGVQGENLGSMIKIFAEAVSPGTISSLSRSKRARTWENTPPVPTTAIYSHMDGAVLKPENACDPLQHSRSENIRVPGSHLGMTHNAFVYMILADRLAQAEGCWQPYQPVGLDALCRGISKPLKYLW